jgi:hypothetical protein
MVERVHEEQCKVVATETFVTLGAIVNFWWKLDVTDDILYYVCEYFS